MNACRQKSRKSATPFSNSSPNSWNISAGSFQSSGFTGRLKRTRRTISEECALSKTWPPNLGRIQSRSVTRLILIRLVTRTGTHLSTESRTSTTTARAITASTTIKRVAGPVQRARICFLWWRVVLATRSKRTSSSSDSGIRWTVSTHRNRKIACRSWPLEAIATQTTPSCTAMTCRITHYRITHLT